VKHLPQSDALASATTAEEIANAPRLREVVSTKKISEVYTEEGYEDSAYDHGGFAKEAQKQEGYGEHEKGKDRHKGGAHDDSESQGTQTEVKQVGAKGEQLSKANTTLPVNTWLRHKVMRNETRMMFVENQGQNGVPMKVMASYSHTIQHPGSTSPDEGKLHSNTEPQSSVKNITYYLKPVQSAKSEHLNPLNVRAQQTPPPTPSPPQHQLQLASLQQLQPPQQIQTPSQQLQPPPAPQSQPPQRLQPLPQPKEPSFPKFFTPNKFERRQDGSLNSYSQLLQHLYGTALNEHSPIAPSAVPLASERGDITGHEYKALQEPSNALTEQQYEESSVSVKQTDVGTGFVVGGNNAGVRTLATPLDSVPISHAQLENVSVATGFVADRNRDGVRTLTAPLDEVSVNPTGSGNIYFGARFVADRNTDGTRTLTTPFASVAVKHTEPQNSNFGTGFIADRNTDGTRTLTTPFASVAVKHTEPQNSNFGTGFITDRNIDGTRTLTTPFASSAVKHTEPQNSNFGTGFIADRSNDGTRTLTTPFASVAVKHTEPNNSNFGTGFIADRSNDGTRTLITPFASVAVKQTEPQNSNFGTGFIADRNTDSTRTLITPFASAAVKHTEPQNSNFGTGFIAGRSNDGTRTLITPFASVAVNHTEPQNSNFGTGFTADRNNDGTRTLPTPFASAVVKHTEPQNSNFGTGFISDRNTDGTRTLTTPFVSAEPQNSNFGTGFVANRNKDGVRTETKPLDSVYQRKHPSIPLEEIQNSRQEKVPIQGTGSDFLKHYEHEDMSTGLNRKEHSNMAHDGRHSQQTSLQERKDGFPSDAIVIGPNKTTHAHRYTSKYKDIRNLKIADDQLQKPTKVTSQNPPRYGDRQNKGTNEKKYDIHSGTSIFSTTDDPLPLWAKFIEALTLAQYSKKGKHFQDPRQGSQPAPRISTQTTGPTTIKPVLTTHATFWNFKDQDRKLDLDLHSPFTQIQDKQDSTSISPRNASQSEILPFVGASRNPNVPHTSSSPIELVDDLVAVQSLSRSTQTTKSSSVTDLQEDQSQHKNSALGVEPRTVSRRADNGEYGTPKYLSGKEEEIRLQEEDKLLDKEKDDELQKNVNEWKDALLDAERGIKGPPKVNTNKYPFYKALPSNTLSVYSPLRYAVNPKAIPFKTEGGMEFYESREHIQCPEVTGPQDVVPKRTAPGEWNQKPKARLPRLRGLGDKIDCLHAKYFGSDPLDNPFFRENAVGLPEEASSDKVESLAEDDAMGFYADILEHIRSIGDINNLPSYSAPKPKYASEFGNSAGQHVPEADNSGYKKEHSGPNKGHYGSLNVAQNPVSSNAISGYPQPSQKEETQSPHSDQHPTDIKASPTLQEYKNPKSNVLKYSTEVPARKPEEFGPFSGVPQILTANPQFENANYVHEPTGHASRLPPQEVILGMLPPPPPPPTPPYTIINTATHTPKIYPTSILSLLSEAPVTTRPGKTATRQFDYRNIQGLSPPPAQTHINTVPQEENELSSTSLRGGHSPVYEPVDVMVAQESSEPETVSDFKGHSVRTDNGTVRENVTHHRERRRATRNDRQQYDDRDNDDESAVPAASRGLNTRKQKGSKSGRKSSSAKKHLKKRKNSVDKLRRRVDHADDVQYDDEVVHNRKGNKLRKGNQRREGSEGKDEEYSDYDGEEAVSRPTTEETPRARPGKKLRSKSQDRVAGRDGRRGEPRYKDKEERRQGDHRVVSRNRNESRRGGTATAQNKDILSKKEHAHRSGKKKTLKIPDVKLKISRNTKLSCNDSEVEGGCDGSKSNKYDEDNFPQVNVSVTEDGAEATPKNFKKINSRGFKNTQVTDKEPAVILEDASKRNDTINKFKTKYQDNVMSADQINRILGGFMSRHNPTYSSKYKAEETTVIPDTTDSTTSTSTTTTTTATTTTTTTASTTTETSASPATEVKGSRSKGTSTSSGSKDFQKARVIPILNSKAIPELVASSTKHPEVNASRRRISTNRSVDKEETTAKPSKAGRGKLSRPKQEIRAKDKEDNQDETESRKEETPEYSTTTDISSSTTEKPVASRRRNSITRANTRKQNVQQEVTTTTTEANTAKKRIPIRIKGTEREEQPTNKDTSSSQKTWRPNKTVRENIVREQPSSAENNGTEAVTVEETENTTTPAPRRLQAIEHRRVTKEEIFTTTYIPEEELAREMERQSELDAEELEAADEHSEKVTRGTNDEEEEDEEDDEEEEEEDIYEPFESYNYESRHIKYPGNRLHNEDKPHSDENWNSKRGYYIYHEPDHSPYDYYRPHRTHKDDRGTRPYEHNYHDYGHTEHAEHKSEPKVTANSKNPGTDNDDDGSSKQTLAPQNPTKVATKDGAKGFYIQRSPGTASTSPSANRSKGDDKDRSSGKVLTYIVNQRTGIGSWVPSDDEDAPSTVKATDSSEADKGGRVETEGPTGVSVRGVSKGRNWRKANGDEQKEEKNAEHQDQKPETETKRDSKDEQVESSGRNRQVSDKLKINRAKPQKGKYSSDQETERYRADADKSSGDDSSKPKNIKQVSQNRLRKGPGKSRQKGTTETGAESQDKSSADTPRGKAGRREGDDESEETSDTYRLDGASRSGKPHHRKSKPRRHKERGSQFKDTDANIDSSASEVKYYEEKLPVATAHEDSDEEYTQETSDEDVQGDKEEDPEESAANVFGEILGHAKRRGESEEVGETVDRVPLYVKHPAERYYYYADEPELVPDTEKKIVEADRTTKRYTDKVHSKEDESIED
jgi:hypothetical protein